MSNVKHLLPVGSVVSVKETDKKLTIIGVLMNNNGVPYDYIAVLYPEGYIDSTRLFVFNHEDITKVEFLGYMDAEFQAFRGALAEEMEKR